MRRRKEHLVEKRDGRREFMRSTKLARSIHLALHSVGVDEDWRALELASVVLAALRERGAATTVAATDLVKSAGTRKPGGGKTGSPKNGAQTAGAGGEPAVIRTIDIADAVQHVLVATGQPSAAVAYGAVGAERARRHRTLATLGRAGDGVGFDAAASGSRPGQALRGDRDVDRSSDRNSDLGRN